MTVYRKSMMESLAEVRSLQEDNMDLMRKAAGKGGMQTINMKDGKLKMDKVTASAIMQIFDKLNPANQKKMEQMINGGKKSGIIKLSDFAMSKVTGFKSEETEIDEAREKSGRQLVNPNKEVMVVKKNSVIVIDKKDEDKYLKQGWTLAEEVEQLDEILPALAALVRIGSGKAIAKKVKKALDKEEEEEEEEDEIDEAKSSSGYELYHRDFSTAMQHAYKVAKKRGYTVDPEEIDSKVASGPKKPSSGKTNSYILGTDKKKNLHVQVYNMDNKKYELNMYIEEVEIDEAKLKFGVSGGRGVKPGTLKDLKQLEKELQNAKKKKDKAKEAALQTELELMMKSGLGKKVGPSWMHKEEVEVDRLPDMRDALLQVRTEKLIQLDEGTAQVRAHSGKGQYKVVKDGDITKVMYKGKEISSGDFDRGADGWFMNIKGEKGQKFFDDVQKMADYFAKNKITEQVAEQLATVRGNTPVEKDRRKAIKGVIVRAKEKGYKKEVARLEEDDINEDKVVSRKVADSGVRTTKFKSGATATDDASGTKTYSPTGQQIKYKTPTIGGYSRTEIPDPKQGPGPRGKRVSQRFQGKLRGANVDVTVGHDGKAKSVTAQSKDVKVKATPKQATVKVGPASVTRKINKEEFEIFEGRMKELHGYIEDGKSAAWIAKKMGVDVKTIKALMSEEAKVDEGITIRLKQAPKNPAQTAHGAAKTMAATEKGITRHKRDADYEREFQRKMSQGKSKLDKEKGKTAAQALEQFEIFEGRMKELHMYIQQGKSAEEIAKLMKLDVKTIKALMSEAYELGTDEYREYLEKLTPGEMDEASARSDAKRAMKSDPSMKQNPFLTDVEASDEDIKGASKNIIMQMRKAVSLRGTHPVEFLDKKKVKIPVKIAQAVQDKYNTFRKPSDKAKFQARVAKSHKDMLLALKENVEVKSFRDSVLDRVDEMRSMGKKHDARKFGELERKVGMTPTPKQQRQAGKVTGAIVTAPFAAVKALKYAPKAYKAVKTALASPGKTAAKLGLGAAGAGSSELKNYVKAVGRHQYQHQGKKAGEKLVKDVTTSAQDATKSDTTKPKKPPAKKIVVKAKPTPSWGQPKPKQKKGKWI